VVRLGLPKGRPEHFRFGVPSGRTLGPVSHTLGNGRRLCERAKARCPCLSCRDGFRCCSSDQLHGIARQVLSCPGCDECSEFRRVVEPLLVESRAPAPHLAFSGHVLCAIAFGVGGDDSRAYPAASPRHRIIQATTPTCRRRAGSDSYSHASSGDMRPGELLQTVASATARGLSRSQGKYTALPRKRRPRSPAFEAKPAPTVPVRARRAQSRHGAGPPGGLECGGDWARPRPLLPRSRATSGAVDCAAENAGVRVRRIVQCVGNLPLLAAMPHVAFDPCVRMPMARVNSCAPTRASARSRPSRNAGRDIRGWLRSSCCAYRW